MADVSGTKAKVETSITTTARYLLGDGHPGVASQMVVILDLNGGTMTYDFQARVPGATSYAAILGFPFNSTTGVTTNTTSMGYRIDATGVEVALNISAINTGGGTPRFTFLPLVG